MKQISIIIAMLVVGLSSAYAQTPNDSITMKKVFGGYQFFKAGSMLNMNQLVETMKGNELAYQQIKSAKSKSTIASIIGGAGGFMVGWPVGTAVGGGEPNWKMAAIGAGLIVISIPISMSFNKKAKQAVDTYNGGLSTSSFWDRNELKLSMTGDGLGLTLQF